MDYDDNDDGGSSMSLWGSLCAGMITSFGGSPPTPSLALVYALLQELITP